MKEKKGRLLTKLLSIGQIGSVPKERSIHLNVSEGCLGDYKTSSKKLSVQAQPSLDQKHQGEEGSSIDKENMNPEEKSNQKSEEETYCTAPSFKLKQLLDHSSKAHCSLISKFDKSPPGEENCIILYTTTIRGVRKTFDECNKIKSLLRSLRVFFLEKDVSMHMSFRDELWRIMGGRSVPPKLFIRGTYIGGAEVVVGLNEEGKLKNLLEGIAVDSSGGKCEECGEMRFKICRKCHGRRKLYSGEDAFSRCQSCNENGLVVCSNCSSVTM